MRGGFRKGAGRPKKEPTVCYHRRVKPEWVKLLDLVLSSLKADGTKIKNFAHDLGAHMICNSDYECEGTIDCAECEHSSFYFE